jgi:hypothetical protein
MTPTTPSSRPPLRQAAASPNLLLPVSSLSPSNEIPFLFYYLAE